MALIHTRFILFFVSLVAFSGATALEVTQIIPEAEVQGSPSLISYLLYDSREAIEPLGMMDFSRGTYQLSNQHGQVQISAELGDEFKGEKLWVQLEIDGVPKGERILLEPAPLGVKFASGNNLNMDTNSILNLEMPAAPGAGTDAANRAYVDDAVAASDNLGNHTLTQNLTVGSYWLSPDGQDDKGLSLYPTGLVIIESDQNTGLLVNGDVIANGHFSAVGDISAVWGISAGKAVQVGPSTETCSADNVGAIRFMTSSGDFSGCTNDANDNGIIGDYAWVKLNN